MTVDSYMLEMIKADGDDVVALISDKIMSVAQWKQIEAQWLLAWKKAGKAPPTLIILQGGMRLERLKGRTLMAPADIGLSCAEARRLIG
jgi:hypothetical protein